MQRFLFAAFVALAVISVTYAETTCETHRRNSRNSAHGLNWKIECDENGKYLPLQCTDTAEKDKWCTCYNEEEAVTGPSKKLRHCNCPLAKREAEDARASECDTPKCAKTGKYETKHCCGGKCYCVNPETGARTEQSNPNANCPA